MNVPWVDPCAFSPSWQLARRKVRQNQACTEHNPSDWQLCPLVTVWLSPKLLYFTEIMIFYGHRFEDNCCILRVVVLQGDTAASFGEEMGGKKCSSVFFPLSLPLSFPHLTFFYLFLLFISLFAFLVAMQSPHGRPLWCLWEEGDALPQKFLCWARPHLPSHGDNTILQPSMKEQTFRGREMGRGESIWRNSAHMVAVHCCLVTCCPDGQICWASGGCKKPSWAWKGEKCQRQQCWRWFLKQARCRCTNSTASPTIHIPDIGTCGWIFLWIFTPKGVNASKNVGNPEKGKKKDLVLQEGFSQKNCILKSWWCIIWLNAFSLEKLEKCYQKQALQ